VGKEKNISVEYGLFANNQHPTLLWPKANTVNVTSSM
jgi:hypothetical protein